MTGRFQCNVTVGKKGSSVADCLIQDYSSRTTGVLEPCAKPCYSVGDYIHSTP